MKITGATHLSFSTIPALLGELNLSTITTILRVVGAYLREFLNGEEGAYSEMMESENRPAQLVEINGRGLPVAQTTRSSDGK